MSWLSFGMILGSIISKRYLLDNDGEESLELGSAASRDPVQVRSIAVCLLIYAAPAIGGFVVVSQMMNAYGTCISL
jgi:hypothetical protein